MSNVYGVAHFAKQNAVPQVEWKNIDIIGQYIDNLNKQKQLEMMDKSYELAKDQAAFVREKFGYDQERDKVKDGQWEKQFEYNKFNDAENRKANFDLEAVKNRNALGQISARENAYINAEDREWALIESSYLEAANRAKEEIAALQESLKTAATEQIANDIADTIKLQKNNFQNTFFVPWDTDFIKIQKDPMSFRGKVYNYQQNRMGVNEKLLNRKGM